MSTMKAQHGHSEACCNIPPVSHTYSEKGSYEEIDGRKSYVTGPSNAEKGILVIFDIFGYYAQTLQGADILATSNDHVNYRVLIPDWFDGKPLPLEYYPPDTKEKEEKVGAFFQKHSPPSVAEKVPAYLEAAKKKYPSVKSWGIVGYCWGGKVVALVVSQHPSLFSIASVNHPAMVEPEDATKIKIPFIMLASGDEPADKIKEFQKNLTAPHHVETFGDQVHGWMAARGDLKNERIKDEYTRGYKTVVEFFHKHWQ